MSIQTGNVGRNDPCPCGSGIKFKKCCLNNPVNLFPKYVPARRHHWSQQEISQIPTDKILEKLAMCGIPVVEPDFLKDVGNCYGAGDIYKRWKERFTITTEGFDGDFPWMAADVLWRRLAPTKVSTEQLDDRMQDGYDRQERRDTTGACELWLAVWEDLKPRFTKEMRTLEATESVFHGYQALFNWCQDLEMELGNAAIDDPAFHERRIRYCREFCELFPDEDSIVPNMRKTMAESLFLSGKREEAERDFEELARVYPDDPWVYIFWGDLYRDFGHEPNPFADDKRAEELYRKALGIDPKEDETVHDRIRDLRTRDGRPQTADTDGTD